MWPRFMVGLVEKAHYVRWTMIIYTRLETKALYQTPSAMMVGMSQALRRGA